MGIAGQVARSFLRSPLTPLVTLASLAMGAIAVLGTPREEEPQISVPMIDVIAALPGASPAEVENLLTRPIEKQMWSIPGVEYIYSMAAEGMTLVTVRFKVGEDQDRSVSRVHAKLMSAMDQAPPGATPPLVKPHTIDDVPILALTLHSSRYGSNELRQLATQLVDEIRTLPSTAGAFVIGGEPRQLRVTLDPAALAASGVTPGEVVQALQAANVRLDAGEFAAAGEVFLVSVGAPIRTAEDAGEIIVSSRGRTVALRNVARVEEAFGEPASYVSHTTREAGTESAVTIAIAKRPGANASSISHAVLERVEQARDRLLPAGVGLEVTRDYGETASEKANELMLHLLIATLSVTALIGIFLGWREALVVLVAVPVTLALTLFVYYALGYTLNRITLFALIFSIGILVDDAIVVVENIYRHLQLGAGAPEVAAVEGVDEVGNPTILATFTVIAAILPMAMVSGLMGPYMRPIPVGASAAMLASLAVAFIVTPWLSLRLLRVRTQGGTSAADGPRHGESAGTRTARIYSRVMTPLIERRGLRLAFYGGVAALLLLSVGLVAVRLVEVKMLPFDNKSEFQVILDYPEGTTLEQSNAGAMAIAGWLQGVEEVRSTQVYAGTAAPFNFNGLVRHYFMRQGANVADVQVNLVPKDERSRQSHAIAVAIRPAVDSIARRFGANAKIAEIPPGPPVLSTLVAEVYAADDSIRLEAARRVRSVMETTPGVVDVDWTVEAAEGKWRFGVDPVLAAESGVSVEQVAQVLALSLSGRNAGLVNAPTAREGVEIRARLGLADRSSVEGLLAVPVATPRGPVPLARFVRVEQATREPVRVRKNLRPVIYVTADVAGRIESPVYAILAMNRALDTVEVAGASIERYNAVAPERLDQTALKWDGEWQVTIEVFRDLGLAFAAVLVLIYVLVVGWFRSFRVPLVIMAPIPLTLIGILPGHAVSGAFFTATSMIGMIALAGIVVRNSILLVDFIELAEGRGRSLREAVLEAGAVRFRPIALTAAAVVIGGIVMVLDPIFQGLAVALMSGAVVATLLTMMVVPLLYWELRRREGGVQQRSKFESSTGSSGHVQ